MFLTQDDFENFSFPLYKKALFKVRAYLKTRTIFS